MILHLFGAIRKTTSKTANIMIFMGVLVLSLSLDRVWLQYRTNHSVIDMVDTSIQWQDPENIINISNTNSPTRTPFQPSTLTPFQPQSDRVTPAVTDIGSLAEATRIYPKAMAGTTLEDSKIRTRPLPERVVIPAIQLDAPIVPIHYKVIDYDGQVLEQWLVPNMFAAGWHDTSALLGLPGNTVLNGHHNAYGQVFKDLIRLETGDAIEVYSSERIYDYQVVAKILLPERYRPIEERIANAQWILPSSDERLTLVTCWPEDSNTGRVVIVAFPINK